jgi:uncharacterized membrane protein
MIKTKFGRTMHILSVLCLTASTLFLAAGWNQIPEKVPGHYNFAGEADSMTGKGTLILIPVMNWLMYLGISALEHFPQVWNTGVEVTAQNRERVYRVLYHMIVSMKLSLVLIFSFMTVWHKNYMPSWFFTAAMLLTFGPMLFFLIQLWRAR